MIQIWMIMYLPIQNVLNLPTLDGSEHAFTSPLCDVGLKCCRAIATLFSKSERYFPKNTFVMPFKNVTKCPSALLIIPPGYLWKQNLAGRFAKFDHTCMTAP